MDRKQKPLMIKVLNSVCACTLIGCLIYIVFAGFHAVVLGAMVIALACAATPVVIAGEDFLEILLGIIEALVDGIMVIVEGIISAISGIFS